MTLEGRIVVKQGKIQSWKIPCLISRIENKDGGNVYVADCPMLHIASHGKNNLEAQKSMNDMVQSFLDELLEMRTFDEVLKEYGWQKAPASGETEPTIEWVPPVTTTEYATAGSPA